MEKVVLSHPARTAIGAFGGTLKDVSAVDLGVRVVDEILSATGVDPRDVDDCIMGNVLGAGLGQNPSRQVAVNSGLGTATPGFSINRVCGSGLQSVALAAQSIKAEDAGVIVAGGIENMSRSPFYLEKARYGFSHTAAPKHDVIDGMVKDGLWDIFNDYHMGVTAENLAEAYNLSKEAQDEFAYNSQMKTAAAMRAGKFEDEIVTVSVPQRRKDPIDFRTDEHPRPDVTQESLARMRAVFKMGGTVTAGNASGINDGAAAVLVTSESKARELGLNPFAAVVSYAVGAVDPSIMGIGPVPAITKALDKANLSLGDIDLFELNEAFAAQSLAVLSDLPIPDGKVNVNGGAIALGHPIGASGTVILVKLLHELRRRPSARFGLAALCIGGGMGVAMVVEKIGGTTVAPANGRRRRTTAATTTAPAPANGRRRRTTASATATAPANGRRRRATTATAPAPANGRRRRTTVAAPATAPAPANGRRRRATTAATTAPANGRRRRTTAVAPANGRRRPGRPPASAATAPAPANGRRRRATTATATAPANGRRRRTTAAAPAPANGRRRPGRPPASAATAPANGRRRPGRPPASAATTAPANGRRRRTTATAATTAPARRGPGRPPGSGVRRGPGRPPASATAPANGRRRRSTVAAPANGRRRPGRPAATAPANGRRRRPGRPVGS